MKINSNHSIAFPLHMKAIEKCPPKIIATPELLAQIAIVNPDAIVLMANMLGVGPCPVCNFIRKHCKCGACKGIQ